MCILGLNRQYECFGGYLIVIARAQKNNSKGWNRDSQSRSSGNYAKFEELHIAQKSNRGVSQPRYSKTLVWAWLGILYCYDCRLIHSSGMLMRTKTPVLHGQRKRQTPIKCKTF